MIFNIKYRVQDALQEPTDENIRKAILIINNFVRDFNAPIKAETMEKIILLHAHFPFSNKTKDRHSSEKFNVFEDLSNIGIKKEIEQICEEFEELRHNKIETKLKNTLKLNDLKPNEFPFHCESLNVKSVVSKPVLRSIDKYKVKQFIAKARINQALKYMLEKCKDNSCPNFEKEVIIQSSRYNDIEKKWIAGLISNSEYNIETTQISRALLDILEKENNKNNAKRVGLVVTDMVIGNLSGIIEFDFRLLNESSTGIMINRIYFKLLDVKRHIMRLKMCIRVSKTYNFDLSSLERVNDEAELIVSQFIKPDDVDRFKIKVKAKLPRPNEVRREILMNLNFKTSKGIISGPPVFCIISNR